MPKIKWPNIGISFTILPSSLLVDMTSQSGVIHLPISYPKQIPAPKHHSNPGFRGNEIMVSGTITEIGITIILPDFLSCSWISPFGIVSPLSGMGDDKYSHHLLFLYFHSHRQWLAFYTFLLKYLATALKKHVLLQKCNPRWMWWLPEPSRISSSRSTSNGT